MEEIKATITELPTLTASMSTLSLRTVAGATSHPELSERDIADQHPISAITGLADALDGKLSEDDLGDAVDAALLQAKESGEFNGADGISPTVNVSKSGKTTTITITDAAGTKTATILDGEDGSGSGEGGSTPIKGVDYYTEEDKAEMVDLVLAALPTWEGGSY